MTIPDVKYLGPIDIRKGGVYLDNYLSDKGEPAITINTSDPVTIGEGIAASNGPDVIHANGYSNVTMLKRKVYAMDSYSPSSDRTRGANFYMARSLSILNCEFYGGGILVDRKDGDLVLTIRGNKGRNIHSQRIDGTMGARRQFIQLNTVRDLLNSVIEWNEYVGDPDASSIEDIFNFYNSSGRKDSPLHVRNNYIYGAFPIPSTAKDFSGSGMTTDGSNDDGATPDKATAYILGYWNQVIKTCNAAINIAAGHHNRFFENRLISSGVLDDGTHLPTSWAGTCIYNNWSPAESFNNNSIDSNIIGFTHWGGNYPFPDRQDEMDNRYDPVSNPNGNRMPRGGNTYLPGSITLDTERAEWTIWQKKLIDNGITIGAGAPVATIQTFTMKVGQSAQVKVNPLYKGAPASLKPGTMKAMLSNLSTSFTLSLSGDSLIKITNVALTGLATVTVSFENTDGKILTNSFNIQVLAADVILIPSTAADSMSFEFTLLP